MSKSIEREKTQQRKDFFWNAFAGCINAAEAVIMSMVVTRTTGLMDAGILSIAFATGNIMMTIGEFGTNYILITDVGNKQSFASYLHARIASILMMIIFTVTFLIINLINRQYSLYKALVIFCVCGIYAFEALESIFRCFYQKNGHLDTASKIFCIRWGVILSTFGICMFMTSRMDLSIIISFVASIVTLSLCLLKTYPNYKDYVGEDQNDIKTTLLNGLPILLSNFISYFILTYPKFLLDFFSSEQIVACFGFISMPIFIVGLTSSFFYQPKLVRLSKLWQDNNIQDFKTNVYKQAMIILGLTMIVLILSNFFGIQVLSSLYATNLIMYNKELSIIILGSGCYALISFLSTILIIVNQKKTILIAFIISSVVAAIFVYFIVIQEQLTGAAISVFIPLLVLAVLLMIFTFYNIFRNHGNNHHYN